MSPIGLSNHGAGCVITNPFSLQTAQPQAVMLSLVMSARSILISGMVVVLPCAATAFKIQFRTVISNCQNHTLAKNDNNHVSLALKDLSKLDFTCMVLFLPMAMVGNRTQNMDLSFHPLQCDAIRVDLHRQLIGRVL